jgi:hypothetical protein
MLLIGSVLPKHKNGQCPTAARKTKVTKAMVSSKPGSRPRPCPSKTPLFQHPQDRVVHFVRQRCEAKLGLWRQLVACVHHLFEQRGEVLIWISLLHFSIVQDRLTGLLRSPMPTIKMSRCWLWRSSLSCLRDSSGCSGFTSMCSTS